MSHMEVTLKIQKTEGTEPGVLKEIMADVAVKHKLKLKSIGVRHVQMGGGKSKAKGSKFELQIAKSLGEWWWKKPFRRTPSSGGWDKLAQDGKMLTCGDIYAEEEAGFPFAVECKKMSDPFELLSPPPILFRWWKKLTAEAEQAKLIPMLVFGFDRKGTYVMVNYGDVVLQTYRGFHVVLGKDLVITPYSDFLEAGVMDVKSGMWWKEERFQTEELDPLKGV